MFYSPCCVVPLSTVFALPVVVEATSARKSVMTFAGKNTPGKRQCGYLLYFIVLFGPASLTVNLLTENPQMHNATE
jgi:hypothetical protein